MNILLYGNGPAGNHGCEAIVRGLNQLLDSSELWLMSEDVRQDKKYGLDQIAVIETAVSHVKRGASFWKAYIHMKIKNDFSEMDLLRYRDMASRISKHCHLAYSIGGDNYCYGNQKLYAGLNEMYRKNGLKTVLWGCSIEPDLVNVPEIADDLKNYSLIVARESLTYDAVRNVQPNTFLVPDPAFYMEEKEFKLPDFFSRNQVIGINMSPMIVSNESVPEITMKNYISLIEMILEQTEDVIALIPHVVWESNDDRSVLELLYEQFKSTNRIFMMEDHTAPELKFMISKCRAFIGARTHATIAAYSSCVPTLVVGYSVKASGIAKDLFGTEEGFVVSVQDLQNKDDLSLAFQKLLKNEEEIREHLEGFIPQYLKEGKDRINQMDILK